MIPTINMAVTMLAPILSPTVGIPISIAFPFPLPLVTPAAGSPVLVPPVVFVNGGCTESIRLESITSIAAICCPAPIVSSHLDPLAQDNPHIRPFGPPEHCFTAATAEAANTGMICGLVKEASCVVAAIQRVRYALKENMSVSQLVRLYSHEYSMATWLGKKILRVALRRSEVRFA
jgi:hypothetical protein